MVRQLHDEPKSKHERRRIIENNITCDVPGCAELISLYKGPDSDTKCREHQLQGVGYGGNAFSDRKYTYHKKNYCEHCGYTPYEDTLRFNINTVSKFKDEADMKRCQNKTLTVDHIDGDHENNEPENCQTLCHTCHTIKTHVNKDWTTNPL